MAEKNESSQVILKNKKKNKKKKKKGKPKPKKKREGEKKRRRQTRQNGTQRFGGRAAADPQADGGRAVEDGEGAPLQSAAVLRATRAAILLENQQVNDQSAHEAYAHQEPQCPLHPLGHALGGSCQKRHRGRYPLLLFHSPLPILPDKTQRN